MPQYRKLIGRLAELCPTIESSQLILTYANIPMGDIAFNAASEINWLNILDRVEARGKLNVLIQTVIDKYEDEKLWEYAKDETSNTPLVDASKSYGEVSNVDKELLHQLVDNGRLDNVLSLLSIVSGELKESDGNTIASLSDQLRSLDMEYYGQNISGPDYTAEKNRIAQATKDQIEQIDNEKTIQSVLNDFAEKKSAAAQTTGLNVLPKAGFEKAMGGKDDSVYIEWLVKAIEASKIVCKVELSTGGSGTGFLIKGGYVLTNHHVVCKHFPYMQNCDFACKDSFDCPLRGQILLGYQTLQAADPVKTYQLDPSDTYIIKAELDYALIKVVDDPEYPLSKWGVANIETFKIPQENDRVNIIQHPNGDRKKMAMPDPVISVWAEKNWIFYLGDTDSGSSGSPVFNQEWKVIALHHAGLDESQGGMTINAAGDKHESNRGILISAIQKDLELLGVHI